MTKQNNVVAEPSPNLEIDPTWIKYEDVEHITPEEFFKNSQFQINAFRNKYLESDFNESNPAHVFWRVARYASIPENNSEYWARRWFHEMYTGVWMAAGSILQGANNPRSVSLANCTTLGFDEDSLLGIFRTASDAAKVAASRQGQGIHFNLRPNQSKVSNAAKESTGNINWIKFIDTIGSVVGQKGRIPAFLYSLSDFNPDLEEFITVKSDQKTIPNANISVHWSDSFMKTLEENGIWEMKYETDAGEKIVKRKPAKEIFDLYVDNNWHWGEPGAQYIDTVRRLSNSDYLGFPWGAMSSNACSEQFLEFVRKQSSGLCMLSSVNFMWLYRKFGKDIKSSMKHIRNNIAPSIMRFIDNIVEMEIRDKRSPIPEQIKSLKGLRRTGIGVTNLDGYLIYNEIGYDTEEGIDIIHKLMDELNAGLYEESQRLGEEKGNFGVFDRDKYIQAPFVKQMMKRHGMKFEYMRNVCCSSIAPTGTLSAMFPDVVSYGIEPIMGLYYWKRQRTSGKWSWSFVIQPFMREILKEKGIDISDFGMKGDSITDEDGSIGEKVVKECIDPYFPKDKFKPAHLINPFQKVELMSRLTKECIDSSISVTYNLPEDVSKETIKQLYIEAWKKEVKSIAIYRDKSRVGVVEFESPRIASKRYDNEETKVASKRPLSLQADVHHLTVGGAKWTAFIGKNENGEPYEIFAGKEDEISLPKRYKTGTINKEKKGYWFLSGEDDDFIRVNISSAFKSDEQNALTRQISLGLRHNVPLIYVIDQLDKSHGTIVDFSKVLVRVFKGYLNSEGASGKLKCKACGSKNLVFEEKCFKCLECGDSRC